MPTPQTHVTLNSQRYKIARQTLIPTGARQWNTSQRPSQVTDPKVLQSAEREFGPHFYSSERTGADGSPGYLGTDYCIDADTRWADRLTLGPLINSLTLSTHDSTYTNTPVDSTYVADSTLYLDGSPSADTVEDIELVESQSGTYAYFARGRFIAKVNAAVATPTLQNDTVVTPGKVWTLLTTYVGTNSAELSAGMARDAYWVNNQFAVAPNRDAWAPNTASAVARVLRQSPSRIVGMDERTVQGNIISGSVTMASPNWNTITTIPGERITPTGFALDGSQWILGYDNGPYMLDEAESAFWPLMPELDRHLDNCRGMTTWFPLGAIIPLASGPRYQRGGFGNSWGPTRYEGNRSSSSTLTGVTGVATAHAGWEGWLYQAIYNPVTTSTYLIAYNLDGDERSPINARPYVIARLSASSLRCNALKYIGTANGVRTSRTLLGGIGSNGWWMTIGEPSDESDDTNYRYASSGTWYGTTMRRYPHMIKDLEAIEVETDDCAAARTATLTVYTWDASGTESSVTLNGSVSGVNDAIAADGVHRRLFVTNSSVPNTGAAGVRRIKPSIALSSNVATTSPTVEGKVRVFYWLRSIMATEHVVFFELDGSIPGKVAAEQETDLLNLVDGSGPVALIDNFGDTKYVTVTQVEVVEALDKGRGAEQTPTPVQMARVRMVEWPTVSGS